ncbi:MAG: low molecular weight phosphotyrosine protein phosphatase [Gemmatimonadetes bacterium]|nr:low molecular weight phosphotyrosine protein phosphatase [Gemmatimonadota bacterium]MCY3612054.1 low molecular weight phosphotyrosine protein phosphatase [Gemmatimonadota bacterium]MCY3677580.1 low molecular weight phosphotyrosine protein phosphatase [Gemmatimonadota bacterium]MYA40286.1 low molecular weight phosphotyrosine protein phosphatase [Gemmatimonadota bacterium]MYE93666.1 low molecular weight phosphotyrosine protein phosphatase [Gemmatimonadota bacterium]
MSDSKTSVLFVCLGNICRSPLAEGIFSHQAALRGLADRFEVDSAGTGAWHTGEPPDSRSIAVAASHGVRLTGTARQAVMDDFGRFDVIVAMDRSNQRSLERLRDGGTRWDRGRRRYGRGSGAAPHGGRNRARIVMMRDYDPSGSDPDVPDPYYGGPGGFEQVYRILERACRALLEELARPDR